MRANLTPGSNHRLGYNDKPPLTLESSDKPQLFRRIIILIETACRLKSAARAKQAGSARKNVQPAAQSLHHRQTQPPPPRQPPFELRKTTATNRASMNAAQSRLNRRGVHQRIGIHKEKNITVSLSRASIASGRNLPVLHSNHLRALLPGNRGRGVTGSIIYHNDLMRLAKRFQSAANGGNTSANPSFLVVCWNDKRNHLRVVWPNVQSSGTRDQMT